MELDEQLRAKIASYSAPPQTLAGIRHTPLVFLVGIAGAGKNAILDQLLKSYSRSYHFIVSHTTRSPRENAGRMEQNGVAYHFVDFAAMNRLLDTHQLIEAKIIHGDNIYGTSLAEIKYAQAEGKIAITDINIDGVDAYMALGFHPKAIFLLPPSYEVWRARLQARYEGEIPPKELKKRLRSALKELDHALAVDYFYIVINDNLAKTVELVHNIAEGQPVEPHYHKAMQIAEDLRRCLQSALDSSPSDAEPGTYPLRQVSPKSAERRA